MGAEIVQADPISISGAIEETIRERKGLMMPEKFRAAVNVVHKYGQVNVPFYDARLQTVYQVPYGEDGKPLMIDVSNELGSVRIVQGQEQGDLVKVYGDREILRRLCPEGTEEISDELLATVVSSRMLRAWQRELRQQVGQEIEQDGPEEVSVEILHASIPEDVAANPVKTDVYRILTGRSYLVTYSSGDGIPWAQAITRDSSFNPQNTDFVSVEQQRYRQRGVRGRYLLDWDKWEGTVQNVEALNGVLAILDTMIQMRRERHAKRGSEVDTSFTARDIFHSVAGDLLSNFSVI